MEPFVHPRWTLNMHPGKRAAISEVLAHREGVADLEEEARLEDHLARMEAADLLEKGECLVDGEARCRSRSREIHRLK